MGLTRKFGERAEIADAFESGGSSLVSAEHITLRG
jgi:hypothetical protein